MKERPFCKGKTHDIFFPYPSIPCRHREWKDGYCKWHHPDEKTRRAREANTKKDKARMEGSSNENP